MSRRDTSEGDTTCYRAPKVEIFEESGSVVIRAEMPDVDKDNFDVGINGNELTLRGKRTPIDPGLRLVHGDGNRADYLRIFTLGDELDTATVDGKVDNGVLTLTLNKKPEILPKKITIAVD